MLSVIAQSGLSVLCLHASGRVSASSAEIARVPCPTFIHIVQINTAAPYFRKETNTRFRSSRAVYFTFEAYMLKRSHHWCYNLIYINGNHRRHSHGWTW